MFQLPNALAALQGWRQFVPYRLAPSTSRPGKTDKFPVDWRSGKTHDAHDPAIWLSVEEAAAIAEAFGPDHGVGFVFTHADPFFFIDIDDCLEAGAWSSTALALMQRFNGAAVEISASGRGLHIIAQGDAGPPPPARKVKYGQFFDLYTENRFVALTGTEAVGDAATVHTPALAQLVREFLTPDPNMSAVGWTDRPDPRWRGPADDNRLIERALKSQSARQAFGTRASFKELWDADADVLAKCYPETNPQAARAYDASAADSALAQALAFWTGNDCERIRRLMLLSALKRDKWDREDYLPRTIMGCVARQHDVLQDKPAEAATAIVAAPTDAPTARAVTGETYLDLNGQVNLFKGCVYVRDIHRVLIPGGYLLKQEQFKVMYGGYSFPMDLVNERTSRNAWEAFTESQMFRSPRADSLCFRPELPPGAMVEDAGRTLANVWWPIETPCVAGDVTPFLNHLAKILPDPGDRAKLLAYMAAVVQYPGRKFQWAPLIQGVPGNGKTFLITTLVRCVGERYSHLPNTEDLVAGGAKFTGWLQQKLFIGLEEIYTGDRRNMLQALLPLITNARIEIQAKGQDQFTGDNRANFMACSNHKDAVPKTQDERRWAIFFTAQQKLEDLARDGMDGSYMPDLYNWFEGRENYEGQSPGYARIHHYLKTFKIPVELNPAGAMHRAPATTSTSEAIELSIGGIEQEILEAISEDRPGFARGWVSSMALDKLLVHLNAERKIPPRRRHDLLRSLGYDYHPALNGGRVNNSVKPDGGKTRLFVKPRELLAQIGNPAHVAKRYEDDQAAALTGHAKFGT